jgi:hypothetical protein
VEDLAEAARQRAELRRVDARGQRARDRRQLLLHHLARAVRLDAVVEGHGDRRDAVARDAALTRHGVGQAEQRRLDGARDEPLDLFGREARRAREDEHLRAS